MSDKVQEDVIKKEETAADVYAHLLPERGHFTRRAEESAKLTLPMLFKEQVNQAKNMPIRDPEQSVGTRGVNSMAAKLVVSLFPMYTPFFKFNIDSVATREQLSADQKDEVLKGLAVLERQGLADIENSGDVTTFNEAMKHLIVVGNVGAYVGDDKTRLYDLNKYVVERDPDGNVIRAVIKEEVRPHTLPAEFRGTDADSNNPDKTVSLYTIISFTDKNVSWYQEAQGMKVPDTESSVPLEGNPWLFLRFTAVDGEDYGRSYVEQYLGDLRSLEVLTKAINDAAKAAAKVVIMVQPNGTTTEKTIADAENLAVVSGNADDVSILRLEKTADMQIAMKMIEEITRRLAHAFMLRADVMRDAERVTAEEVRIVARELDETNGGIYSLLSKELQLPYVKRRLFLMRKRAKMPKLPEGVELAIVTGFAAIGRAGAVDRIMAWIEKAAAVINVQGLEQFVDKGKLLRKLAQDEGVDLESVWISEQQQQANASATSEQQMSEQLMPEIVKGAMPAITAQMQNQQPPEGEVTNG